MVRTSHLEAMQQAAEFVDTNIIAAVKPPASSRGYSSRDEKDPAFVSAGERWKLIREAADFILRDNELPSSEDWCTALKKQLIEKKVRYTKITTDGLSFADGYQRAIEDIADVAL